MLIRFKFIIFFIWIFSKVNSKTEATNSKKIYDKIGAEYPAEHNVGHEYKAKSHLKKFYRELDPTNFFNPGIGKTSKKINWK